jgi:hypothetical protein
VHEVDPEDPGAKLSARGPKYHANVHLGELHWGTNPSSPSSDPASKTSLTVEVDYVRNTSWPGNGSPFEVMNPNRYRLTEAIERNYALYGIDLTFVESDELTREEIRYEIYVGRGHIRKTNPEQLNRWELGRIEDNYHDDSSTLHMLWGTEIGINDPAEATTIIDRNSDYSSSTGLAWHVGSPDAPKVNTVEKDFGIMVARDEYSPSQFQGMQSVAMHELGHALSIGWNDDAPIPFLGALTGEHAYEVYSGSTDSDLAGGVDPTPEYIPERPGPRWSLMSPQSGWPLNGSIQGHPQIPVYFFSIEELSTADHEDIPSKSQ